jgi:hypothetical protein
VTLPPEATPRLDHRLELLATALLALAAVATAWATYQSARWHGKQAEAQSASIAARVESDKEANVANRQAQIDVALFTQWVNAYGSRNRKLAVFYEDRFTARFEPAFRAWIATKPLVTPGAPSSPFDMSEYKLAALQESERLERVAAAASDAVRLDIQRADNYTLAVVLFAVTLFFAGISTKLRERSSRIVILALGYTIFLGTAVWIATFPVTVAV